MISVVIATHESERLLVPTLAALVPGAIAGIVREVIVADAGSRDGTATLADTAGCRFVVSREPLGARLKAAAALARGPWLLFLRPGTVPDATWVDETTRFVHDAELAGTADMTVATFRLVPGAHRRLLLSAAIAQFAAALGGRPTRNQGLLISKRHYDARGGHRPDAPDPEADFIGRLARRHFVLLQSRARVVRV
jgi:Glycosyl transferase family 2